MKTTILCLIAVALLTACAVPNRNLAGKVDNRDITLPEFMGAYRGHFENFMFENGRRPDNEEKKELERLTWRNITIHVILHNHFDKYRIRVTEQEVLDTLTLSVPPYIRTSPLFQSNGNFNQDLYLQALNIGTPVDLTPVKKQYYEYYIPVQKLKQKLIDTVLMTKTAQQLIEKIVRTRADVDWVVFNPREYEIMVSDSDIEAYYQTNLINYSQAPYFVLEYVLIPVQTAQDDLDQAERSIAEVYGKLQDGEDFAALARQYSTAPSATSGGDIGFVRVSDLELDIEKQLNATPLNGFTHPLEHEGGWIIYQVEDRTKSFFKLHEIVIDPRPGTQTIHDIETRDVRRIEELTQRFGLSAAAGEYGWDYHLTGPISRDSLWIKDMAVINKVREELESVQTGQLLEPIYSPILQSWLIIGLRENQSRQFQPMSQVRHQISRELVEKRRNDIARQMAGRWLDAWRNDNSAYPTGIKVRIISTPDANIDLQLMELPARDLFYHVIRDHYSKSRIEPYQFGSLFVIPVIKKTRLLNAEPVSQQLVRQLFIDNLDPAWFDRWMEDQVKRTRIVIRYNQNQ